MAMITRNKYFFISLITIAASVAGLLLSALLILEYFGIAPAAADIVCSRGSGVNACTIVSASRYAAMRGLPFTGDVPIAVFGFIFYGFIAAAVLMHILNRNNENSPQLYILILFLSAFVFMFNIALYLISVFIIKFVCPLCAMSYASTAVILISSIIMLIILKMNHKFAGISILITLKKYLKINLLNFITIAVVLAVTGLGVGELYRQSRFLLMMSV